MFFRKEMTLRRETPYGGKETLLPLELLNMPRGEQLPENKGRQAGEPSNWSICGTVENAEKEQRQRAKQCKEAERLFLVHRDDCTVCKNPESDQVGSKANLRGFIHQNHSKIFI